VEIVVGVIPLRLKRLSTGWGGGVAGQVPQEGRVLWVRLMKREKPKNFCGQSCCLFWLYGMQWGSLGGGAAGHGTDISPNGWLHSLKKVWQSDTFFAGGPMGKREEGGGEEEGE